MSNDSISSVVQGVESTRSSQKGQAVQSTPVASNQGKNKAARGNELPETGQQQIDQGKKLDKAVSEISDFVQNYQRKLQFSVDRHSGRTIIKVIDSETDKVIREIPPEHVISLAKKLDSSDSAFLQEQA